jgi:hypothetical protein
MISSTACAGSAASVSLKLAFSLSEISLGRFFRNHGCCFISGIVILFSQTRVFQKDSLCQSI